MRLGLRRLEQALEEQARSVAAWRNALGTLGSAVGGLRDSLMEYRGAWATTARTIEGAHAAARRLDATADAMLARSGEATPPLPPPGSTPA